ncbi:MAG: tetraacyldisaccharide 4'-kinase [Parachlamydiaceae bacterium]|nr:tetraacyldisaccharide 4'-kinase [Parachlamydiaceae bacterium]
MKSKKTENYFFEIVKGQRKGFVAAIFRFMLLIFSWIFQCFAWCRNWVFDHGWLRRYCPPVPLVISIGNIVVGGTGKTPMTLLLAKEFYGSFQLAILTRGYRSKAEKLSQPTCLCLNKGPLYPASYCGDEPFLLAQNLPDALIYVGRNRHKSSIMAVKAGAKMILLDDGMQHRRLSRDLDVVVMDVHDPYGLGYFLPRGFLREGAESLSRAHMIVLNHVESTEQFEAAKALVRKHSVAPVVGARANVTKIFDFKGEKIESLVNKKVGIFCGIAHPEYFKKTVEGQGAIVLAQHNVSDHCDFDLIELEKFSKHCLELEVDLLLCTEKDRVRFTDGLTLTLPVAWLQIELSIVENLETWKAFIIKAKSDVMRRM